MRERLGWFVTLAGAIWLSTWIALATTECITATLGLGNRRRGEPVGRLVEEVLAEHHGEDTPIVHAFEEALDEAAEAAPAA